jgi:hypothetical protein
MRVRFHLSFDLVSKRWHLEAHDMRARRWFLIAEASWSVQLERLCRLGMPESELKRLTVLETAGKVSAWLEAFEIDAIALIDAGFILQPTTAAVPRQLLNT